MLGEAGLCGMLLNPMYSKGGYILDEKGHFIDPAKTVHLPPAVTNVEHFVQDNWRVSMVVIYCPFLV